MTNSSEHDQAFKPESWDEFCDQLKQLGQTIVANSPDQGLDQTEGFRYLARLTQNALGRFTERPNPLRPAINYGSPRIGGDNPDFIYGSIAVRGGQRYRIRGNRRDAFNIGFGSYYGGLGSGKGLQCSGYVFLNDLAVGDNGDFELTISQEPIEGNWLPMLEASNSILIRQTVLNRGQDRAAELQVELVEGNSHEPVEMNSQDSSKLAPLTAAEFEKSLQFAGLFVGGVVGQFLGWTDSFKTRPNEIHPIDPKLLQFANGDPSTRYHNGYFELCKDEVLLIELDPPDCEYWNIQLANYWLESLDYLDYQTHFNHANAAVDDDGKVRLAISQRNPGVENWMDTAGHSRGCIAMRWIKADQESLARTKLVSYQQLQESSAKDLLAS
ncbi:MAG: hypothetical protein AAGI88_00290 [Pseudomonadota bacterium]